MLLGVAGWLHLCPTFLELVVDEIFSREMRSWREFLGISGIMVDNALTTLQQMDRRLCGRPSDKPITRSKTRADDKIDFSSG